jgi:hypothetical protein
MLAVERRDDGAFLGSRGPHPQDWYPEDLELGWRLARRAVARRQELPACPCAA